MTKALGKALDLDRGEVAAIVSKSRNHHFDIWMEQEKGHSLSTNEDTKLTLGTVGSDLSSTLQFSTVNHLVGGITNYYNELA